MEQRGGGLLCNPLVPTVFLAHISFLWPTKETSLQPTAEHEKPQP